MVISHPAWSEALQPAAHLAHVGTAIVALVDPLARSTALTHTHGRILTIPGDAVVFCVGRYLLRLHNALYPCSNLK